MRLLVYLALLGLSLTACGGSAMGDRAGETPEAAFDTYRALLAAGELAAESQVLTTQSGDLLRRGYSTGQQRNEASALDRAGPPQVAVREDRAVIRFQASASVSPYFLRNSSLGWQVDLASMASSIVFDRQNHWRFSSTSHPYMFAFQ